MMNRMNESFHVVEIKWQPDGMMLYAGGDGPFVITHIVTNGSSEGEKAVAVLPEPIAILNSDSSRKITLETFKRLVWRSALTGEVVPAPKERAISALFYNVKFTKPMYEIKP
jgi:hypothetical protein